MSDPLVSRVYSLTISGYDDSLQKVQNMSAEFAKMDAAKTKLNKTLETKIASGDANSIQEITTKIKQLETSMASLSSQRNIAQKESEAVANATNNTVSAYSLLIKSYKDAKIAAQEMAAEFGVNSEQANVAAASAAGYKSQLDAINVAVKNGGVASPLPQIKNESISSTAPIVNNNLQTDQLKAEKIAVDNLEGSYNLLKAQRKELEALTASGNQTSIFTSNGQTFNYSEAVDQIKQLKIQEAEYTDSLKIEKTVHEQIIAVQDGSINQIKQERVELESIIRNSSPGSTVSFQGNSFNYDEAIAKAKELQTAETELSSVFKVQKEQIETLPGTYYSLLQAQKQAIEVYRQTPSDSPLFEEIKQQAAEATAQVQAFNRSLSPDGTLVGEYKSGIINAFKELGLGDLLKSQSDEITASLNKLKEESQSLASQLKETGAVGSKSFQEIEQQLRVNIEKQDQLKANLSSLDTALAGTGGVGEQITKSIASGFENAGRQIKTLVAGYIGFQALFSGFSGLISENKQLGDSVASLEIYLHGSKEEAQGLISTLKSFDTKTSITGLADIATLVAQKGVAKDQIAGVTQAFDQLFTSLSTNGQSQDVHAGVFEIAKLISIFHDDHEVTPQRVRELGNAFFSLQSTGPVSNEFLQDFAARVGAVRSITGAAIPQILGFGAAFQQLGQREEVAGSATSILLSKMLANVDKFAKVAGILPDKLREIININPFEGLLAVAESIKKNNPAKNSEQLSEILVKAIGDLGVKNVRARGAFSELINNAELFRTKMAQAGNAINDTSGLLTAFQTKQETFSGTLEKISKEFELVGANQNFQNLVKGVADGLLFIVKLLTSIPFGVVIGGITAMTAAWLFYKGNLTLVRLEQSANNEATLLGFVRLNLMKTGLFGAAAAQQAYAVSAAKVASATTVNVAALTSEIAAQKASIASLEAKIAVDAEQGVILEAEIAARRAHVIALESEVVATESATVATEGLNVATKANPLGIILTLLALIIPSLYAFGFESKKVTAAIKEQNDQLKENAKFNNEIAESIQQQTGKTKNSISELISIIQSETSNLDLRKRAYQALISISPDFIGTVDAEYNATSKLNQVYDDYIKQLDKVARAKAIQNVNQKIQDDLALKQSNEFQAKIEADQEAADNKTIAAANQNKLKVITPAITAASSAAPASVYIPQSTIGLQSESHVKSDALQKAKDEATKSLNESKAFKTFMESASAEDKAALIAGIQSGATTSSTDDGATQTVDQLKIQLADVNKQIAAIDSQKNKSAEELAKLKELRKQRTEILREIKEINKANDVTTSAKGNNSDKLEDEYNRKSLDALAKFNQDELTLLKNKYQLETDDQNRSQEERNASLAKYYQVSKQIITNNTQDQKNALNLEVSQADTRAGKITDPKKRADALIAIEQYKVNKLKEIDQDSNVQTEALDKKLFDEREKSFTEQMNTQIANAKATNKQVQDNPLSTPGQKLSAQITEDNSIIRARAGFFLLMQELQTTFNQNAKTNWVDFGRILSTAIATQSADIKKTFQATLDDIDLVTSQKIEKIQLKYDALKQKVLTSDQSNSDKNNSVDLLNHSQTVETAGVQQNANVGKLLGAQQEYNFGLITTKQFQDIYAAAVKGQENLNNAIAGAKDKITTVKSLVGESLNKLFGFEEGSDNARLMAQTISDAFSLAGTAMNAYFDNEQNRIRSSLKLNEQRLDIELQQAKSRSQSQAESNSLDAQFASKKVALEKDAFEKDKKLKKEQLSINFAIQLSNIAVSAAENPLNGITLGTAGIIQYAVQAAIATASYLINLSSINSAQFAAAKGGRVPALSAGKITQSSNIPTQSNGDNVLATVRTDEVILNEEQQRKAGGPSFFKSLGVPGFAGGGAVSLSKDHVDQSTRRTELRTLDVLSNTNKTSEEKAVRLKKIVYEETFDLLQLNKVLAIEAVESNKRELPKDQTTSIKLFQSEQRLNYAEVALNKFTKEHDHSFVHSVKESIVKSFENVSGISLTSFNSEIIKMAASSLIKNTVNEAKSSFFESKMQNIIESEKRAHDFIKEEYLNHVDSVIKKEIDKTNELNKVSQSSETTSINKSQSDKSSDNKTEESNLSKTSESQKNAEFKTFANYYSTKIEDNQKKSFEEKKVVAMEKLAVDLHGNIIKIKESVPAPFSYIPVSKVQNKYNRDVENVSYVIHNIERGNSVSSSSKTSKATNNTDNKSISSVQHFFTGGKAERLPNGKITVPSNIPVQPNGDDILATVKSKEVILNEKQQQLLGGAITFRAIGVPGFASGGVIQSLGGFDFNDNKLQPPINPSSFLNPGKNNSGNDDQMKKVYDAIDKQTENINQLARQTNQRIDKIKVINVARETEKVNNDLKKASNIGRIN